MWPAYRYPNLAGPYQTGRRRASFTPASLPGLLPWYRGAQQYLFSDAAATVPVTDGGTVYWWLDASGNGFHASQPDPNMRPTAFDLGGGQWCVTGDGIDDEMVVANRWTNAVDDWSLLYVGSIDTTDTERLVCLNGTPGDNNGYGPSPYGNSPSLSYLYPGVWWQGSTFIRTVGSLYQHTGSRISGELRQYANGSLISSGTLNTPTSPGNGAYLFSAGGQRYLPGTICELFFCAPGLGFGGANQLAAEAYLRSQWGL